MTSYKYNEVEYAKIIYDKGFQTNHLFTEIKILAIYLKNTYNYKPKQLKEELYKYCEEFFPGYNRVKHYKIINSALSQVNKKNSGLIQIDKIVISTSELNYINSIPIDTDESVNQLHIHECRKLLFTLLVLMKLNQEVCEIRNGKKGKGIYFQGGVKKYNDLKKTANLNNNIKINEDIIHTLSQNALIEIKYNGLIKLCYIKTMKDQCNGSDCGISVINFNNIGWYYDYYLNIPKMKLCKHCNQPFRQTRKDLLYCPEHKGYQPVKVKTIKCIDCGQIVTVDSKNTKTERCHNCYQKYRREYKRAHMQHKRDTLDCGQTNLNLKNPQT